MLFQDQQSLKQNHGVIVRLFIVQDAVSSMLLITVGYYDYDCSHVNL